ncbi:Uncharacterised protein [uncultured archaeon]|nr:Uncharacterised protein [uncultured archaeon]
MMRSHKGMLHTLEAIIAFLMVIGFIVFVMPAVNKESSGNQQTRIYVYKALSNMEKTGKLQSLAAAQNLTGIQLELNSTLALPMKFTVAMSKSNISHGTVYPKAGNIPAYINFTADKSSLDSASLALDYANASDPAVYINNQYLSSHSGNYSGNTETFEISPYTQTGANSVMINASTDSTISYSMTIMNTIQLSAPEENKSVTTIGYIISGNRSAFSPSEVRVYVWK